MQECIYGDKTYTELSLDKDIIEKAKKYAKQKHTSLSNIVENYFYYITSSTKENNKVTDKYSTPITDELSGSIGKIELDTEKEITKYLMQKYIHE